MIGSIVLTHHEHVTAGGWNYVSVEHCACFCYAGKFKIFNLKGDVLSCESSHKAHKLHINLLVFLLCARKSVLADVIVMCVCVCVCGFLAIFIGVFLNNDSFGLLWKQHFAVCLSQIYVNKIDYPRVGVAMREPMKRGGRLSSCVLLVSRVRHPKRIPTTAQ